MHHDIQASSVPPASGLIVDPSADRLGRPEGHGADPQVGRREPAGGALALDGAARHSEGGGHFVEAQGQPFDGGSGGRPGGGLGRRSRIGGRRLQRDCPGAACAHRATPRPSASGAGFTKPV
jgi:hypothetical protein